MADKIYRIETVVGQDSTGSLEGAIHNALFQARADQNFRNWFEVQSIRGVVDQGGRMTYQVELKVGFTVP